MGKGDLLRQLTSLITVHQGRETLQRWYVASDRETPSRD